MNFDLADFDSKPWQKLAKQIKIDEDYILRECSDVVDIRKLESACNQMVTMFFTHKRIEIAQRIIGWLNVLCDKYNNAFDISSSLLESELLINLKNVRSFTCDPVQLDVFLKKMDIISQSERFCDDIIRSNSKDIIRFYSDLLSENTYALVALKHYLVIFREFHNLSHLRSRVFEIFIDRNTSFECCLIAALCIFVGLGIDEELRVITEALSRARDPLQILALTKAIVTCASTETLEYNKAIKEYCCNELKVFCQSHNVAMRVAAHEATLEWLKRGIEMPKDWFDILWENREDQIIIIQNKWREAMTVLLKRPNQRAQIEEKVSRLSWDEKIKFLMLNLFLDVGISVEVTRDLASKCIEATAKHRITLAAGLFCSLADQGSQDQFQMHQEVLADYLECSNPKEIKAICTFILPKFIMEAKKRNMSHVLLDELGQRKAESAFITVTKVYRSIGISLDVTLDCLKEIVITSKSTDSAFVAMEIALLNHPNAWDFWLLSLETLSVLEAAEDRILMVEIMQNVFKKAQKLPGSKEFISKVLHMFKRDLGIKDANFYRLELLFALISCVYKYFPLEFLSLNILTFVITLLGCSSSSVRLSIFKFLLNLPKDSFNQAALCKLKSYKVLDNNELKAQYLDRAAMATILTSDSINNLIAISQKEISSLISQKCLSSRLLYLLNVLTLSVSLENAINVDEIIQLAIDCRKVAAPILSSDNEQCDLCLSFDRLHNLNAEQRGNFIQNICWRVFKYACMLVSNSSSQLDTISCEREGDHLRSLLGQVRHVGALSIIHSSYERLLEQLLSKNPSLVQKWISHDLSEIIHSPSQVSDVKRRSGGLPLKLLSVAHVEIFKNSIFTKSVKQGGFPMLNLIVESLLTCLEYPNRLDETNSVHCIDILVKFVRDAQVWREILGWQSRLCLVCLALLKSSNWAIRNSLLQLFALIIEKLQMTKLMAENFIENNYVSGILPVLSGDEGVACYACLLFCLRIISFSPANSDLMLKQSRTRLYSLVEYSPSFNIRERAAELLGRLLTKDEYPQVFERLLKSNSSNALHGFSSLGLAIGVCSSNNNSNFEINLNISHIEHLISKSHPLASLQFLKFLLLQKSLDDRFWSMLKPCLINSVLVSDLSSEFLSILAEKNMIDTSLLLQDVDEKVYLCLLKNYNSMVKFDEQTLLRLLQSHNPSLSLLALNALIASNFTIPPYYLDNLYRQEFTCSSIDLKMQILSALSNDFAGVDLDRLLRVCLQASNEAETLEIRLKCIQVLEKIFESNIKLTIDQGIVLYRASMNLLQDGYGNVRLTACDALNIRYPYNKRLLINDLISTISHRCCLKEIIPHLGSCYDVPSLAVESQASTVKLFDHEPINIYREFSMEREILEDLKKK